MEQAVSKSWWQRHWFWAIPALVLAPIIICGGFITLLIGLIFGAIKSSDAYTHSLAAARADTRVQAALGTPIEPGFLVSGKINVTGPSGHADISYGISGPKAQGTIYAVADKTAGQWTFTTLVLQNHATGERLNLVPVEAE